MDIRQLINAPSPLPPAARAETPPSTKRKRSPSPCPTTAKRRRSNNPYAQPPPWAARGDWSGIIILPEMPPPPRSKPQNQNHYLKAAATATNGHSASNNHSTPHPSTAARAHTPSPLPTWEPSITAITPYDELSRRVCDFLYPFAIQTYPGASLEIEAKIGTLLDRYSHQRVELPVLSETVLDSARMSCTFQSSMTEPQHRQMNKFLNDAVASSCVPPAGGGGPARVKIAYTHPKERDTFHALTPAGLALLPPALRRAAQSGPHAPKVRLTTDQKTRKVTAAIVKTRLGDLDIFSPGTPFDCRVSVNLEMSYPFSDTSELGPPVTENDVVVERLKDRMSYSHLAYRIDLTQVTRPGGEGKEKVHELEVEVGGEELGREARALEEGRESRYEMVVRGFVDNVRVLTRAARG
ncbi:hypothetical protein H2201_006662 [Coniosporium apollinis]|uniref:mRNA-capping enzyme subunit beta n=1 Tax=Coniosporium apollinis TaxID=61459 RepID=A0ABQ9NT02_9PEZI|nr:hypothetical protein H2201_006662 [Coniosporium apollinis]